MADQGNEWDEGLQLLEGEVLGGLQAPPDSYPQYSATPPIAGATATSATTNAPLRTPGPSDLAPPTAGFGAGLFTELPDPDNLPKPYEDYYLFELNPQNATAGDDRFDTMSEEEPWSSSSSSLPPSPGPNVILAYEYNPRPPEDPSIMAVDSGDAYIYADDTDPAFAAQSTAVSAGAPPTPTWPSSAPTELLSPLPPGSDTTQSPNSPASRDELFSPLVEPEAAPSSAHGPEFEHSIPGLLPPPPEIVAALNMPNPPPMVALPLASLTLRAQVEIWHPKPTKTIRVAPHPNALPLTYEPFIRMEALACPQYRYPLNLACLDVLPITGEYPEFLGATGTYQPNSKNYIYVWHFGKTKTALGVTPEGHLTDRYRREMYIPFDAPVSDVKWLTEDWSITKAPNYQPTLLFATGNRLGTISVQRDKLKPSFLIPHSLKYFADFHTGTIREVEFSRPVRDNTFPKVASIDSAGNVCIAEYSLMCVATNYLQMGMQRFQMTQPSSVRWRPGSEYEVSVTGQYCAMALFDWRVRSKPSLVIESVKPKVNRTTTCHCYINEHVMCVGGQQIASNGSKLSMLEFFDLRMFRTHFKGISERFTVQRQLHCGDMHFDGRYNQLIIAGIPGFSVVHTENQRPSLLTHIEGGRIATKTQKPDVAKIITRGKYLEQDGLYWTANSLGVITHQQVISPEMRRGHLVRLSPSGGGMEDRKPRPR